MFEEDTKRDATTLNGSKQAASGVNKATLQARKTMGWVKIHRDLLDWPYYRNSEAVHLFIHLLLKANHTDQTFEDVLIQRGQLMTGRLALARDTGLTERKIRTLLQKFIKAQFLTIQTTNKFSIITILNYDSYQSSTNYNDQQNDQQATSKRPANDHKQECIKNDNNEKEGKGVRLSFSDVESFFKQQGSTPDLALKFFNFYSSNNWHDTKGNPVTNWQAKAQKWLNVSDAPAKRNRTISDLVRDNGLENTAKSYKNHEEPVLTGDDIMERLKFLNR